MVTFKKKNGVEKGVVGVAGMEDKAGQNSGTCSNGRTDSAENDLNTLTL